MTKRPFDLPKLRAGFVAGRALPDFASFDAKGRIALRLSFGRVAVMDSADFARIRAERGGVFPRPFFNFSGKGHGYVRFNDPGRQPHRGNNGMLARLILGLHGRGGRVTYRDGNRLNLTRENLALEPPKPRRGR